MAGITTADGITNPPIDDLLDVVDSKYRLVIMAAKRASHGMRLGRRENGFANHAAASTARKRVG